MRVLPFLILNLMAICFSAQARVADDNLTWELAKQRKEQVKKVGYSIFLEFRKGNENFKGKTIITLELNHLKRDLSIDALLSSIESVKVNGEELKEYPSRKGSFDIPKNKLTKELTVEVSYTSQYSVQDNGLKRIKDLHDGEEYIYSNFQPYYAHWLFPCLDQPDLRATYAVTVNAPSYWKVIHNDLINHEKEEGEFKTTIFQQTKPFSTYLFFLAAGPYVEFKDNFGKLPLSIHARKSISPYVDHQKIFDTTKKGLVFYNDYFSYPHPFTKYAMIFVPELVTAAMENPGAITLHESYVFRGPVSVTTIDKRDDFILHEMAHMWFGDLVTMKWWNDLWLIEGFATYAATLAQERALNSTSAAMDFLNTKRWGIWLDQNITTHPVEIPVPDVRTSKGIFDGITYGKGASAIKQLHFYIGEDGFREGIRSYLKNYEWKNADRKDFINSLSKASGKKLDKWAQSWLQSYGLNRVSVDFKCKDSKVSHAEIKQRASSSKTLSPHRIKLGLYNLVEEKLIRSDTVDVYYETARTSITSLVGKACPDFILPNVDDYDYAIFMLDQKSLKLATSALSQLPDPLSRLQMWMILMQMVREQELSPEKFFATATEALRIETNESLIGILLNSQGLLRSQYLIYLTMGQRKQLAEDLEKILWSRIMTEAPGSTLQISFYDYYVSIAQTPDALSKILKMIKTNEGPQGIKLSSGGRWDLIIALARNGHVEAAKLIDQESKNDKGPLRKRNAFMAKTTLPDLESKRETFNKLVYSGELSYSDFRQAAPRFFMTNYPEIGKAFVNEFFDHLVKFDWQSHDDLVAIYFEKFFPISICDAETEKLSLSKLKAAKNLTNLAKKSWLAAHDELSRCVKVRSKKW